MQLDVALQRYEVQLAGDGRSEHTIRQVRRHARLLSEWLKSQGHSLDVAAITHEDVARFLASDSVRLRADGKARLASSSNALRSSLRGVLGFAHAAGYVASNPARLVRRARTRPPSPKALTEADTAKLLDALDGATSSIERRDRVLFVTMLRCGLRLGSALGLDVEDVDYARGELVLRTLKGGGEASAVMPDDVAEMLREHIGARTGGPVFVGSGGERLGARHARRRLAEWGMRAGVAGGVHPHQLRHTCGERAYRRTGDVLVVASVLLHRSVSSAAIYAHADREMVRRALA